MTHSATCEIEGLIFTFQLLHDSSTGSFLKADRLASWEEQNMGNKNSVKEIL